MRRKKGLGRIVSARWVKKERGGWASGNDPWYVAAHFGTWGLGVVRTYWGWRILLARWQFVLFEEDEK
jgi:hypothetical protein